MATELLTVGSPHTIAQTTVYALPDRACVLFSDVAVEISNSTNTGFVVATASTTTGLVVGAQFVRCTTGAAVISLKLQ